MSQKDVGEDDKDVAGKVISPVGDSEQALATRERLNLILSRFESGLTEDDLDAFPVPQSARFVHDEIHDQFRQF